MLFAKIRISPHAVDRYRERIMTHRHLSIDEKRGETISRIYREIDLKNTIKVVTFGDKYKFVFTKSNTEFRFEKSRDGKQWIMVTCVRHNRMLESEEPLSIKNLNGSTKYGIRTAIRIRESQKIDWEKSNTIEDKKLMK